MSETEIAAPDEPDPDETGEDEDETTEEDDNDDQPEAEQSESAATGTVILTDKEEKKQEKALEAETLRHAARISAILGEAAIELIPCEACHKNTPGWHYPAKAFEVGSVEYNFYAMLAGGSGAEHKHPDYFKTCEECNGYGNVLTGAQMGLITYEIACPVCKTQGYIDTRAEQPATAPVVAPVNGTAPAPLVEAAPVTDMWGRPPSASTFGKLPIFLTPDERAADLQAGYNLG